MTILEAQARLEAEGLHVSSNGTHVLWIAAAVCDVGEEIKLSQDACSLMCNSGRWVAVFPAAGLLTYEIAGSPEELVSLIRAVYAKYRQVGGAFPDAFRSTVSDPEQYLVGRPLARV